MRFVIQNTGHKLQQEFVFGRNVHRAHSLEFAHDSPQKPENRKPQVHPKRSKYRHMKFYCFSHFQARNQKLIHLALWGNRDFQT